MLEPEKHKKFIKQGTEGYLFEYQTLNDIKDGQFKKIYQQVIGCNCCFEKYIYGNFKDGMYNGTYDVHYREYESYCPCCNPDEDDDKQFEIKAKIIFNLGTIVSYEIKQNDKDISVVDDLDKQIIISILDIDDNSKMHLYKSIFKDQQNCIMPNILNRVLQNGDYFEHINKTFKFRKIM